MATNMLKNQKNIVNQLQLKSDQTVAVSNIIKKQCFLLPLFIPDIFLGGGEFSPKLNSPRKFFCNFGPSVILPKLKR